MHNLTEINNLISAKTSEIYTNYPELVKYISEIPVSKIKITSTKVAYDQLVEFDNSLTEILTKYKKSHLK